MKTLRHIDTGMLIEVTENAIGRRYTMANHPVEAWLQVGGEKEEIGWVYVDETSPDDYSQKFAQRAADVPIRIFRGIALMYTRSGTQPEDTIYFEWV